MRQSLSYTTSPSPLISHYIPIYYDYTKEYKQRGTFSYHIMAWQAAPYNNDKTVAFLWGTQTIELWKTISWGRKRFCEMEEFGKMATSKTIFSTVLLVRCSPNSKDTIKNIFTMVYTESLSVKHGTVAFLKLVNLNTTCFHINKMRILSRPSHRADFKQHSLTPFFADPLFFLSFQIRLSWDESKSEDIVYVNLQKYT